MVRIEATAEDSLAAIRARSKLGIAIAAMIRMIATTIRSSIREKPFCRRIGNGLRIKNSRAAQPFALPRRSLPLHHVNLGAVLVELDLVHQLVDEVNSPAVIGIQVLAH